MSLLHNQINLLTYPDCSLTLNDIMNMDYWKLEEFISILNNKSKKNEEEIMNNESLSQQSLASNFKVPSFKVPSFNVPKLK